MPQLQQPGGKAWRRRYHRRQQQPSPINFGGTFGSGLRPRCSIVDGNETAVASVTTELYTGSWTNAGQGVSGIQPQRGDLVIISINFFKTAQVCSQTSGPTFTFQSTGDSLTTGTPTGQAMIAWRIWDGTENADPVFSLGTGGTLSWIAVAIAPDAGQTVSIDAWATTLADNTSTTAKTPNSATAAGTGELSLIFTNAFVTATGFAPNAITPPSGWTDLNSINVSRDIARHTQTADVAFKTGVASGSVTPGADAIALASDAVIYHVLVKQGTGSVTTQSTATLSGVGNLADDWRRFSPVRLDAGGTQQVIAKNGNVIILGSDTQGYYRSTDDGDHWEVINRGVGGVGSSDSWRQSAAIAWSTTETNTIYSCTGEGGAGGGLLVSTNGGDSWFMRSSVPQFAGNHEFAPLPTGGKPRSTGTLIAQDSTFLFVATYAQGIMRSANNGTDNFPTTCTMAGVAPGTNYYARGLIKDPANAGTLYAAFYDYDGTGTFGHVWKCTSDTATTPDFTKLTASPAIVEEMTFVGTSTIYAACGAAGLFRTTDGGTTWTNLNGAFIPTTGHDWFSIDGYVDASGNHVILLVDSSPSSPYDECLITVTIPSTWPGSGSITYSAQTGSVQATTMPPDNRLWWMQQNASTKSQILGQSGWQNGNVRIDASNLSNIKMYAAGNCGFYRNLNGTGWTVASNGIPGFPARNVACDPNTANHVVFCSTDWNVIDVSDGVGYDENSAIYNTPISGKQGYALSFDPVDSTVYAASGDKGVAPSWGTNSNGTSWFRAVSTFVWTDTGLATAMGTGNVPLGLQALRDGSNVKILLASVWNGGIWRGVYNGTNYTWTQVSSTICNTSAAPGTGNLLNFAYSGSGQYVYLYDPDKGVYRSNDYGVTWVQVYAITSTDKNSVAIAANPATAGEVWVTSNTGLYEITGAHTGTVGSGASVTGPITLPSSASAGCVILSSTGSVYVSTKDVPGSAGTQMYGSPNHGLNWYDVVGDNSLAFSNSRPSRIAIAADGRLYMSGSNQITQGYPITLPTAVFLNDSGSGSDSISTTHQLSDSGAGSDSLTTAVATSLTDAGSGNDVLTITVAAPLVEVGAGTDSVAIAAAIALTDSGTASDSLAITVPIALADSGSGSDSLTIAVGAPLADSGTSSDALILRIALTDSGVGSDAQSVATITPIALTDSGTGSDSLTLTVALADNGTATDALTVSASAQLSDSGTASDSLAIAVSLTDSGSASDTLTTPATIALSDSAAGSDSLATAIALTDSGTASDAIALTATAPLSDSGVGSDSLGVATGSTPTLSDTGTGTDSLTVQVSLADSGVATDSLAVNVPFADSGSATDALAVTVRLTDSGSGTETVTTSASIQLGDSGTGSDTLVAATGTPIALTDSGTGADSLTTPASIPLAESAAGSDTVVIAFAIADSGTGTDSLAAGQQTLFSESGTGSDTLAVSVKITDSGAASDALTATAAIAFIESGAGTDALTIAVSVSETATGADSFVLTVSVPLAESAAGTDALNVAQGSNPSLNDSGTGTDSLNVIANATPSLSDSGTGADSLKVGISFAETGIATDVFVLNASAVLTDSGSGIETLVTLVQLAITDSGSGSDVLLFRIAAAVVLTAGLGGTIVADRFAGNGTHDSTAGSLTSGSFGGNVSHDQLGGSVQIDRTAGVLAR